MMQTAENGWKLRLARMLWFNMYRAQVTDEAGEYLATLRLIPAIPLDREEVPPDAPEVEPYVLALVEDAVFSPEEMVQYEERLADMLMEKMAQPDFNPAHVQFAYPSPPKGGPMVMELGS